VSDMGQQWRDEWAPAPAWEGPPPYRAIEMEIGRELRERMKLLQELPHNLLTLLMQLTGEEESE
jgi:hypothetical protein